MIPVASLEVECQMINPPRPTGFVVRADGRTLAVLDWDTVVKAVKRFDDLLRVYEGRA